MGATASVIELYYQALQGASTDVSTISGKSLRFSLSAR